MSGDGEGPSAGVPQLDKDHKGDEIPVSDTTVYSRYAYKVECPRCGVAEGDYCVETGREGPVGAIRSPHQRRAELAREVLA